MTRANIAIVKRPVCSPGTMDADLISGAFRVIYLTKFAETVYVLHAFQKKSRKTDKGDIELARHRFRALVEERKRR